MATGTNGKSAAIRAKLNHPIIDSDGHWIDYAPAFLEYLRDSAGPKLASASKNPSPSAIRP